MRFLHRPLRVAAAEIGLALALLAQSPSRGSAHGPAPSALSIVDQDAQGPRLVRLSAGLARREQGDRFRFLCPAAWGDASVLPAAVIPGGPVVIAGGTGLFLMAADGSVAAHPDALGAGPSTDLVQAGGKLYVLRTKLDTTELLDVGASQIRVVFSEADGWTTLAATDDFIGLQRLREHNVEQLRIGFDGAVLGRESAPAPADSTFVSARATTTALYAAVATAFGRELGVVQPDHWQPLATGSASIAGPVELASGAFFVAVDSVLARFSPEHASPLDGMSPVSCLGRHGSAAYACTREGLVALGDTGLGAPLFELSGLIAPDVERLTGSARSLCQSQWEHLRFDLLALGIPVDDTPAAAGPDAGGVAAVEPAADGGGPARLEDVGCACRSAPGSSRAPSWGSLSCLLGLIACRCRRRKLVWSLLTRNVWCAIQTAVALPIIALPPLIEHSVTVESRRSSQHWRDSRGVRDPRHRPWRSRHHR